MASLAVSNLNPSQEPATSDDVIQRFLTTQNLEKPLVFAKHDSWTTYVCCQAWFANCMGFCIPAICMPRVLCQPSSVARQHGLKLDREAVYADSATNDCCWHIAENHKTIPLDKIQDVQVQESCCETMFKLKSVKIQTAAMGTPEAEVSAAYLKDPETARAAIQLAVRLHQQRAAAPVATYGSPVDAPGQAGGMQRDGMQERLARLQQLVQQGVLTNAEEAQIRPAVLVATQDPLAKLFEGHDLQQRGMITSADFAKMKEALLRQLLAAA